MSRVAHGGRMHPRSTLDTRRECTEGGRPSMKQHGYPGFSLIEAMIVVGIGFIMAGIALPIFTNAMNNYRLSAAVSAAVSAAMSAASALARACVAFLAPGMTTVTSSNMRIQRSAS